MDRCAARIVGLSLLRFLLRFLLLCPALAASASAAARVSAEHELIWYQVEVVLFAQRDAHGPTLEQPREDASPIWPPETVALGPVHPEPVRPSSIEELAMQWDDAWARPRLLRVTPGLTPEDEALIAWLRRENARGRTTGLEWQAGLGTLTWKEPEPQPGSMTADGGAGATAATAGPETTADDSPADAGTREPADAASTDADPGADRPPVPVPVSLAFRSVAPQLRHLNDEVRRLERARGIRVLRHLAWRQPFVLEAPGIPVQVLWLDPGDDQPALLGTVAIDLRRFLHATVDLHWRLEGPDGAWTWTHVLENRRMRSGELHYVDHPHVGALIRIERFALAEPLAADAPVVPASAND